MIFHHISYRIAAQFTMFVFLLLLLNGVIFLGADIGRGRRQEHMRLDRMAQGISISFQAGSPLLSHGLPPGMRERIRIVNDRGETVVEGALFQEVPFRREDTVTQVTVGGEPYVVFTRSIVRDGSTVGYVQVADAERPPSLDLRDRALLYLLVSGAISALTFVVGLYFARRSLRPAEQMMERLEQFTQDASHELRTPLAAVSTSLDLAMIERDNRTYIQSAKKDLKDITVLIERLLELARLDRFVLRTEPVDLSVLTEDVIAKHQAAAEKAGVRIERELAPRVTVRGDRSLLRQAIGNLLSNAIKFNKSGGKVSVRLTSSSLVLEDTGKGISPEALPHVFDRFYREDASRAKETEGLGLGLALVKRIMDLHGWTIDVRSVPGKGATFAVHLVHGRKTAAR